MLAERSTPSPGSRYFAVNSGPRTPPSKYQWDPVLTWSAPPLSMTNRVRPSVCSLSVQLHTAGVRRRNPGSAAASCHSSSVGSRPPTHAA